MPASIVKFVAVIKSNHILLVSCIGEYLLGLCIKLNGRQPSPATAVATTATALDKLKNYFPIINQCDSDDAIYLARRWVVCDGLEGVPIPVSGCGSSIGVCVCVLCTRSAVIWGYETMMCISLYILCSVLILLSSFMGSCTH